ncbi:hypothetical protein ALC57_15211, partial [Trachymyrmex cornetzi]
LCHRYLTLAWNQFSCFGIPRKVRVSPAVVHTLARRGILLVLSPTEGSRRARFPFTRARAREPEHMPCQAGPGQLLRLIRICFKDPGSFHCFQRTLRSSFLTALHAFTLFLSSYADTRIYVHNPYAYPSTPPPRVRDGRMNACGHTYMRHAREWIDPLSPQTTRGVFYRAPCDVGGAVKVERSISSHRRRDEARRDETREGDARRRDATDGTERTPSRLGSATPTGRISRIAAAAAAAAVPWQTFTTRRVAQQPPRDSGKFLAVTWRLDDWRRVDEFVGPHVHLRLFLPCSHLFVVFHCLLLLCYHPSPSSGHPGEVRDRWRPAISRSDPRLAKTRYPVLHSMSGSFEILSFGDTGVNIKARRSLWLTLLSMTGRCDIRSTTHAAPEVSFNACRYLGTTHLQSPAKCSNVGVVLVLSIALAHALP